MKKADLDGVINKTVLITGMQKGVESYCKNIKTAVEKLAKIKTLTVGIF